MYVGERKVIDVFGETTKENKNFDGDMTTCVWSSGKTIASILMAVMRDRGHIDYDERVSNYWPEFAQENKGHVTVKDALRHESGLEKFDAPIPLADCQSESIKQNSIGKVIEKQRQHFAPDTSRAYHGITRDWVTNEIFRRVEP